jgi:hypothetical protein
MLDLRVPSTYDGAVSPSGQHTAKNRAALFLLLFACGFLRFKRCNLGKLVDVLDHGFIEQIFSGAGQLGEFLGRFHFTGFDPKRELLFGDASLVGSFANAVHFAILSRTVRAEGPLCPSRSGLSLHVPRKLHLTFNFVPDTMHNEFVFSCR